MTPPPGRMRLPASPLQESTLVARPARPARPARRAEDPRPEDPRPADPQAAAKEFRQAVQTGQTAIGELPGTLSRREWESVASRIVLSARAAIRAAAPFADDDLRAEWLSRARDWTVSKRRALASARGADALSALWPGRELPWERPFAGSAVGLDVADAVKILRELEKWVPPSAPLPPCGPARAAAEADEYEAQIADVRARLAAREGGPAWRADREADRELAEATRAATRELSAAFDQGAAPSRRLDRFMANIAISASSASSAGFAGSASFAGDAGA